jgi:hypothetical protein
MIEFELRLSLSYVTGMAESHPNVMFDGEVGRHKIICDDLHVMEHSSMVI